MPTAIGGGTRGRLITRLRVRPGSEEISERAAASAMRPAAAAQRVPGAAADQPGATTAGDQPLAIVAGDRPPAAVAGDQPLATSDCYAGLRPILRRYVRRWVPPDDVDDVVQAAFVDLWRTRARYDPARNLQAWALTIARRRAIDYLRSRPHAAAPLGAVTELAAVSDPPGEDGRDLANRLAETAYVRAALSALPPAQREAIELAYYGDLTQREIAERLHVPIGTVKARTARGLRGVRELLTAAQAS
jgi:RNA polymerase sigma factor (sigma-70 family)